MKIRRKYSRIVGDCFCSIRNVAGFSMRTVNVIVGSPAGFGCLGSDRVVKGLRWVDVCLGSRVGASDGKVVKGVVKMREVKILGKVG